MGSIKGLKKIANSTLLGLVAVLLISCSNIPDNYTGDGVNIPGLVQPIVTIQNLHDFQMLNSAIVITGTAHDTTGIASVTINIDGTDYSANGTSSWTFDLLAASLFTGEHLLTIKAANISGIEGILSLKFYFRDGVDIQPVKVDAGSTTVNRQTLQLNGTVKVDIRNNSTYSVGTGYRVLLFEDFNNNQTYDSLVDRVLGYVDVPSGHAAHAVISVVVPVNSPVLFADNLIYAFVDANGEIDETDENNNVITNMTGVVFTPPVGQFNPVIKWHWTGSAINPTSNQVISSPVVAPLVDNNGDGKIDANDIPYIIFNSYIGSQYTLNGTLRAIRGDGSGELFSVTTKATHPISNPAVGDIDNDGKPEIVVMDDTHRLMAFSNTGVWMWTSSFIIPFNAWKSITIADIDEDGTPEIIVGDYVFNNDGTLKWSGGNSNSMGSFTPCIAKLLQGGHPQLIAGNTAYNYDGSIYWHNSSVDNGFTAVADVNNDGFPEVVVVSNGRAWLLKSDGSIIWGPIMLPSSGGGPPTIADVDGDGIPDIGIACGTLFVVLNADGTLKWSSVTKDASSQITGSSVFDFEADGKAELIYADELFLRIYRGSDGYELFNTPIGSGTGLEIPIVVDVDNDNKAEIVVVSNDLLHIINPSNPSALNGIIVIGDANDTWVNTRKIWNQHSYHVTNVNDDASIPQFEINNWLSFNNYRQNQMLNPLGAVDLSASYMRVNSSLYPASVDITARIGNSGALFVATSFFVAFYDGDPQAGGVLIGTREITGRIDPGTYVDVTLTWNNPVAGAHTIYVVADDDGIGNSRIREISEMNNTVSTISTF